MAKQIIVEGQTATNHQTGAKIIYRGGKWYPIDDPMAQASAPKSASMSAEARVRAAAGLGPAIEAQKNMFASEGWNSSPQNRLGQNPYGGLGGSLASLVDSDEDTFKGKVGNMLAKSIGGQRYQDYNQASKSFEAAFLPMLSGASVTASEAQRMIRASLPAPGDSPETLAKKAKNRAMMINGVAELMGQPPPFPRVQSMKFGQPAQAAAPLQSSPQGPTQRPSLESIFGQ